jgi:antitoxin component YwqK of YwqJK toxin-antitoxin module
MAFLNFRTCAIGLFLLLGIVQTSFAQNEGTADSFATDSIPDILVSADSIPNRAKKKKRKKNVFYGLKTRKGFTKVGRGKQVTIETFHLLKVYTEPNPYVGEYYVFDVRKRKVLKVTSIDKKNVVHYRILHGPYKKTVGGEVVESGIFYVGTKHGRWERYGKNNILLDKVKFYKGWPKESEITYFDNERTKVKEVKPIINKELNGTYCLFHEKGWPLIQGKYIDGIKVGLWVEYFTDRNKRKREIQYPANPYKKEEQFEPYVLTEWDDEGNLIIQNGKALPVTKTGSKDPSGKKQAQRPPNSNRNRKQ